MLNETGGWLRGNNDYKYVEDDEVDDHLHCHVLHLKIRILSEDVRLKMREVDG